jgi:branched-chain amino acid aminotransferase
MGQNHLLKISRDLAAQVENFSLPTPLGFGQVKAPLMARVMCRDGVWVEPEVVPCEPFQMDPFCKTLHYGQQIFEGMKAYKRAKQEPVLFRLDQNLMRLNASAQRMAMPPLPQDIFYTAVKSLVHHLSPIIPTGYGESLYLRPIMFAMDEGLSLGLSKNYMLLILASPSGAYFDTSAVKALIERETCRAVPGGTGYVKVAGNYGSSLLSAQVAKQLGYQQTLWLDAAQRRYIEEFSGMNFFAVVDDTLLTPRLTDTILPGVTRDSLITLARKRSISVEESTIDIDELIQNIRRGSCTEVFACGTAAVVSPVAALGEKSGQLYEVGDSIGPLTKMLRDTLMSIQYQVESAPEGWIVPVN